ncbi:glycosyltransferase [Candidatus Neomarinimicrobiota bacterium]
MTSKVNDATASPPELSIIICNYHSVGIIHSCLSSLCQQDYSAEQYEIVIIDDGSQDGSADIIKAFIAQRQENYPLIRYYRKTNAGLSAARNDGLIRSRGEIVSFIDDDAVADIRFVSHVVSTFRERPEVNCVGGRVELLNPDNRFAQLIQHSLMGWYMDKGQAIIGTNMSYRRPFLEEVGGFQPEFTRRGDETALFAMAGDRLVRIINSDVIVYHRQPESAGDWIRKKWDSGYFEAAVDHLKYSRGLFGKKPTLKLLGRLAHILGPWIIIAGFLLYLPAGLICLLGYFALLIRRHIVFQTITGPIKQLVRARDFDHRWSDFLQVAYLAFAGGYRADLGYVRGYFKFYRACWEKPFENKI